MSKADYGWIVESLLFAAGDEGLSLRQVCSVIQLSERDGRHLMEQLKEQYENDSSRGIKIVELAHVYQLATKKKSAPYIKKLVESPSSTSLSQAALEILAITAYKQPITRIEIEDIRGVKTDRPLQTLVAKGLLKEVGRKEGPGRAILYGTTKGFLDYFGLKDLEELPPLSNDIGEDFVQGEADLFFGKFTEAIDV